MKSSAVLRADLESALGGRFAAGLDWRARPAPERVSTGIAGLDALTGGGLPRGAITEIHGQASSGRTSLMVSMLAAAAAREEICALADAGDAFDPASAEAAGVDLSRLLWVRCGGNPEHALKAADLLIQAGGFGLVALDLGDVSPSVARRIPLAAWFRLRRAIEDTPAVMLLLEREQTVKSCASLVLEMCREAVAWSGAPGCSRLLRGARLRAASVGTSVPIEVAG
jgi:recombination protein RecA